MSKVKAAQLREERKRGFRMAMYNPEGKPSNEERQKRMSLLNSQWNSIYGPEATQLREERKSRMTMLSNRLNNPNIIESNSETGTESNIKPNEDTSNQETPSSSPSKSKHKSE